MDLKRKLEIVESAIKSITEHDDASDKEMSQAIGTVRSLVDKHEDAAMRRRLTKAKE